MSLPVNTKLDFGNSRRIINLAPAAATGEPVVFEQLTGLVHTTGTEIIAGQKTFTSPLMEVSGSATGLIIERTSSSVNISMEYRGTGGSIFTGLLNPTTWAVNDTNVMSATPWISVSPTSCVFPGTVSDVNGNVRSSSPNLKAASYVAVATDAGNTIYKSTTSAISITINSGVFSSGDEFFVVNNSGSGAITLVAGSGVAMFLAGNTAGGNRTVGPRGVARVWFLSQSVCYVGNLGGVT